MKVARVYLNSTKELLECEFGKQKKGGRVMECIYIPHHKTLTLKITGEIDEHTTETLRRKMDHEITRFLPRKVLLDFQQVNFMDSAGIGMLLGRYKLIRMLGGELEIIQINRQVRKLLEMSGILKIIRVSDDLEQKVG